MTPEQIDELERSSSLYQTALAALGAQAITDSLSLWADVAPVPNRQNSEATAKWLAAAVAYVMHRRLRARDLALAYYRYQRAIATGKTIALPGRENPEYMTLPELKREFEASLATNGVTNLPPSVLDEGPVKHEVPAWAKEPVPVEHIPDLEDKLNQIETDTEPAAQQNLQVLGPSNLDNKIKSLNPKDSSANTDANRAQAHKDAGNRQAASAARNVMNGARGPLFEVGSSDGSVLGFVRASKTGTPCGWCAMLISRGFVAKSTALFKSNQGSGVQDDGTIVTFGDLDLYHDNCQCYCIPVFSTAQLKGSQFAINREYARLWPIVTRGLHGRDALTEWRRYFRNLAKSQKTQVAAAA